MDLSLENELCKIDPIFFEELISCYHEKSDETKTCMYWGCECNNGWFYPIKDLVEKTSFLNKLLKDYNTNCKIVAQQIKQKYGELIIYETIKYYDENVVLNKKHQEIINIIQSIYKDIYHNTVRDCFYRCELCGEKNNKKNPIVTTTGWISRICKNCATKNKLDYKL